MSPERVETDVDGRQLSLTNLSKVLYPDSGFTKGDVLNYYAQVSEVLLPHLADRTVTFKRFPDGVDGKSFFEKHAPAHAPDWVRRAPVPRGSSSRSLDDGDIEYAVIDDRPSLIWATNLASLEFHVPLWRIGDGRDLPKNPDYTVFDLDPGPGTTIVECCKVARWLTARIGEEKTFAKTSGSKGLQLYVRAAGLRNDQATEQAHALAQSIEHDHPDATVSNMRKDLRKGKVLIDWSQNNPAKTTVAAYSLRARSAPTVSTPVTWAEVDSCARRGDPAALRFEAADVLERVGRFGDLFTELLSPAAPTEGAKDKVAKKAANSRKAPAPPSRRPRA